MSDPTSGLIFDEVAVAFVSRNGAKEVVHGVSLQVVPGEIVALVGESGSGKSVLSMSALGLLPATARVSGQISVSGTSIVGADKRTLRRVRGGVVGTVFQEPMHAFNPLFRIGSQIGEAIKVHQPELNREARRERVQHLLKAVGLRDTGRIANSYPHQLSGGQLQRSMIAQALSSDPKILIADEPTTALDVTVQAGILQLLRETVQRIDLGVLIITHDMGVVADVADRVVVMQHGRVVERGDAVQVLTHPQNDYTRVLMDAVPRLGEAAEPQVDEVSVEGAGHVVVTDLQITYPKAKAPTVHGVSFTIPAGRTLGLVGESGSGKSTIGEALATILPISGGDIEIDGVSYRNAHGRGSKAALQGIRKQLGIVFQDSAEALNPKRSVGYSLTDPIRIHENLNESERRQRAVAALEAVELPGSFIDRYPHEMSGGQRQRVAIARALILNPSVVIADEPTSALDVAVQSRVIELFKSLQQQYGFSSLFISHDLAVIEEVADQVAVLNQGRLVEYAPTTQVLGNPQDPYTQRLLAAIPVADPIEQRARREARNLAS